MEPPAPRRPSPTPRSDDTAELPGAAEGGGAGTVGPKHAAEPADSADVAATEATQAAQATHAAQAAQATDVTARLPVVAATPPAPVSPPADPAPDASSSRHTRRWLLAGGLAVIAGGAAGVAAETVRRHYARPPSPPVPLSEAAAAERVLIADLDATTGGDDAVRDAVTQVRADHVRHLAAIEALLARYATLPVAPRPRGTPGTLAVLRAAERTAAHDGARRARAATGSAAALLASIAACEASHDELFA